MTQFNLTLEQVDDLYNKAEEIHGNISLIRMFCEQYYDVDDFYKLRPILNYTEKISDFLYAELVELKNNN